MAWVEDRDSVLTDAQAAGEALAALFLDARQAMADAQAGDGTGEESDDWSLWRRRVGVAVLAALVAGGVTAAELDSMIGPLTERGR